MKSVYCLFVLLFISNSCKANERDKQLVGLGGGDLLRSLEMAIRANPEAFSRQQRNLDSVSGINFGGSKRLDPSISTHGGVRRRFDETKRARTVEFDEIDRSGFDHF